MNAPVDSVNDTLINDWSGGQIEEFSAVVRPHGPRSALFGDLPLPLADVRKRAHVDLGDARFVRLIRNPAPISRHVWIPLPEWPLDQFSRRGFAAEIHEDDVLTHPPDDGLAIRCDVRRIDVHGRDLLRGSGTISRLREESSRIVATGEVDEPSVWRPGWLAVVGGIECHTRGRLTTQRENPHIGSFVAHFQGHPLSGGIQTH